MSWKFQHSEVSKAHGNNLNTTQSTSQANSNVPTRRFLFVENAGAIGAMGRKKWMAREPMLLQSQAQTEREQEQERKQQIAR